MVFGLVWRLSDWERDRPVGSGFGLLPRGPRGRLGLRRQKRALGLPVLVRPGYPVRLPGLPPRPQFSSVSSKQSARERSVAAAVPVNQLGPDFAFVESTANHLPGPANLSVTVDEALTVRPVFLPEGIQSGVVRIRLALS